MRALAAGALCTRPLWLGLGTPPSRWPQPQPLPLPLPPPPPLLLLLLLLPLLLVPPQVLVASHHPLCFGSAPAAHLAWDWQDTCELLLGSRAFVAALAGHSHQGGYACIHGRHFVTLEAILEGGRAWLLAGRAQLLLFCCRARALRAVHAERAHNCRPFPLAAPPKENAYGFLSLFPDRIEIEGHGRLTTRVLQLHQQ